MIIHNSIKTKYQIDEASMSLKMAWAHLMGMILPRFSSVEINKGDRIGQITLLEHKGYLFSIDSKAKRTGGFGSTDKKDEHV